MKKNSIYKFFVIYILSLLLVSQYSLAVDDEPLPEPSENTTVCPEGKVWDKKNKKCVDIKNHNYDDQAIYQAARELAYHKRYRDSILLLSTAKNKKDPKILNYLGFSHRKIGKISHAMAYYEEAIAIDPDYIVARSYMGQGYLSLGKEELAIVQLNEIKKRGGEESWAYTELKKSIKDGFSFY